MRIVGKLLNGKTVVGYAVSNGQETKNLPVSQVIELVKDKKIEKVRYIPCRCAITGVDGFELKKLPSKQIKESKITNKERLDALLKQTPVLGSKEIANILNGKDIIFVLNRIDMGVGSSLGGDCSKLSGTYYFANEYVAHKFIDKVSAIDTNGSLIRALNSKIDSVCVLI